MMLAVYATIQLKHQVGLSGFASSAPAMGGMGRGSRAAAAPAAGSRGPIGAQAGAGGSGPPGRAGIGSAMAAAPSRGMIGPGGASRRDTSSRDAAPRAPIGARSAYRSRKCFLSCFSLRLSCMVCGHFCC